MKEYHVTLVVHDCTSVDASSTEEAEQIATDIFKENYNLDGKSWELITEEE